MEYWTDARRKNQREKSKWKARNDPSSLEQFNEKARLHGMSYGYYVNAVRTGAVTDAHATVRLTLDEREGYVYED